MYKSTPIHQSCLIVLVGPPGSGKSEWCRRNSAGAVVVSQDELIDAITPHGFDHAFRCVYAAAEDSLARAALSVWFPVIVDRTNRTRAHRAHWTSIARETGTSAVAVAMTASHDLCRARNRSRTDHRRVSDERMERMLAAMEPVDSGEGFARVFRGDESSLQGILEFLWRNTGRESYEQCRHA